MYLSKVFRRYSMAAMSVLSYPYPPRRGRIRYIHVNYLGKRKREVGERERGKRIEGEMVRREEKSERGGHKRIDGAEGGREERSEGGCGLGLWCMNSRSRKIRRNHERISSPPI